MQEGLFTRLFAERIPGAPGARCGRRHSEVHRWRLTAEHRPEAETLGSGVPARRALQRPS